MKKIQVNSYEAGERIDSFLAKKFPEYSRNYFSNLIDSKLVLVNDQSVKSSYKIKDNDEISIDFTEVKTETELKPENIKLNIIYEDDNVIVVNKQAGLVVHPACGNKDGTLVNALINYFPKIQEAVYDPKSAISKIRPGLVHRLDKDTSGILIVAKNAKTMRFLSNQIQRRSTKKTYFAICFGQPRQTEGKIVSYLGRSPKDRKKMADIGREKGKEAITYYRTLRYLPSNLSLVEFKIETGRTHQIRVQSANMGNPVLGDSVYGSRNSIKLSEKLGATRQMLHAFSLEIKVPDEDKPKIFVAKLPEDFTKILNDLKINKS